MSSSESIEKPTGPCAACKKEGATKRCRGCLDVGVDIFFCNRECQLKHWKTHKILCGKDAALIEIFKNANSKKKVDKALRKFLKESHQSIRVCANCRKTEKEDVKLDCCSACDNAVYCSRECQKAHWPKHKILCKQNSAMRQHMDCTLTASEKNIHNLLNKWKSNPTTVQLTLHAKFQQLMDISERPPTKVMLVRLEFDYNARTFVFAEEPKVVSISQSPENCQVLMMKHALSTESSLLTFLQYAFVTCKDLGTKYQSLHSMHFGEDYLNIPMEKVIQRENVYKYLPLKSDLFDGWDVIRKSNLKKQIDYLNNSNTYNGFLCDALHLQLFNKKIRLTLCGIVIYAKLGKELGQITNFIKYEDMSKSEFNKFVKNASISDILEIPPHPHLLQLPPVMVAVVYKDIETNSELGLDSQFCKLNKLGKGSVKKRKKDADHSFKQLQSFVEKMPSHVIEKVTL